jgi:hypothetical protein
MEAKDFLGMFSNPKPVMAMLHLKGDDTCDVRRRFARELDIYLRNGVDSVIVEDYFGTYSDMVWGLEYLRERKVGIPYGVNCLNVDAMGFELAMRYGAAYVQLDSVVGHVKPRDEESIQAFLDLYRGRYRGCVLGGVRFKYQPVLSENDLDTDLRIAEKRCDAVAVTQDATGQETSLDKIRAFRAGLGDFPLIVAAGVTAENAAASLAVADGMVVGSYFKRDGKDSGEVDESRVAEFMRTIRAIRKGEQ